MFKKTSYTFFNKLVASYNPKKISLMRFFLQLISYEYINQRKRIQDQNRQKVLKQDKKEIKDLKLENIVRIITVSKEIWDRAKQIYQEGNYISFNTITSWTSDIAMAIDKFFQPSSDDEKCIQFKFKKIDQKQFLTLKEYLQHYKQQEKHLKQNQEFIQETIALCGGQPENILLSNRIFRVESIELDEAYDNMYIITLELAQERLLQEKGKYYFEKVLQEQSSTIVPLLQNKQQLIERLRQQLIERLRADINQLIQEAEKQENFRYSPNPINREKIEQIIYKRNEPIPNIYGKNIQKDQRIQNSMRQYLNQANYKTNKLNDLYENNEQGVQTFNSADQVSKFLKFSQEEKLILKGMYGQ